jgi:hypothetical protein
MHKTKKRNFEILPVIEFLHRICLHIPNPYESLIRYYGYYSNAARGKRNKTSLDNKSEPLIINDAPNRSSCRLSWARLIHLIYEVDPLSCPSCGSTMKIIAFITDRIIFFPTPNKSEPKGKNHREHRGTQRKKRK